MEDNMEKDVESVGEILRNARLKKGKTLNDVADELCIRRIYLTAIEDMDFANIPEMPYGLGFIRSYAQYLGLNSDRIVASYRQIDDTNEKNKFQNDEENIAATKPSYRHIFLGLFGVIALMCGWMMLSSQNQKDIVLESETSPSVIEPEIVETDTEAVVSDVSVEPETVEDSVSSDAAEDEVSSPKEETTGEHDAPDQEADVTHHMRFELTGPSWLELKQGKKVLLNGLYNKGFTYDIPSEKDMFITVGRHYNIIFYVDDEPVKVVSALKKKNVKLDAFMQPQE